MDLAVVGDQRGVSANVDAPRLALIIGCARSGTTLLRSLLDAHPDVACPPEAALPSLAGKLSAAWTTAFGLDSQTGDETGTTKLRETMIESVRASLLALISTYCKLHNKIIYCDKSLDSAPHLDLVEQIFPDVKVICMYRHPMDTVLSGIEASPWGFSGYGFGPFVASSPDNFVAALTRYWLESVQASLAWERKHISSKCLRIRYEDLVTEPEATLAKTFAFLGVDPSLDVLETAFSLSNVGDGDHKILYTTSVHKSSLGRGRRVPVNFLSDALREEVNVNLRLLGYHDLDLSWNSGMNETAAPRGQAHEDLIEHMDLLAHCPPTSQRAGLGDFMIVAEDSAKKLRWVVKETGEIQAGDGQVSSVLVGNASDIMLAIRDESSVGLLLRSNRVRQLRAQAPADKTSAIIDCANAFQMLRRGLTLKPRHEDG